MKQLFIIGPSGVGKTTLCKNLTEIERTVVHVSFDEQVKMLVDVHYPLPQLRSGEEGREFWGFCKGVIDNLSRSADSDITLLFDVDAGAEYIPECQAYLMERTKAVICVTADPDLIYQREIARAAEVNMPIRDKDDFFDREFSPQMQRLYESAGTTVDISDKNVDESLEHLRTVVNQLRKQ